MPSELKPCPGCGATTKGSCVIVSDWPDIQIGNHMYAGFCCMCGWRGPVRSTYEDAIVSWNRRAGSKEDTHND